MILPIHIYGHPILRKVAKDIDAENYPDLDTLIENMFETMYSANGIGLAAPQIGLSERIFVVDLSPLAEVGYPELKDFKRVFINAHILERTGKIDSLEEGCLSIPGIGEKVDREEEILISYLDEKLTPHEEMFTGYAARAIQHEYDHLDGILFVDKISPFRKRLIRKKLLQMQKGKVDCDYRIKTA